MIAKFRISNKSPFYAECYDDILTLNYKCNIDFSIFKDCDFLSPFGNNLLNSN